MVLTTSDKVRLLTNLSTTDVSDEDLDSLIGVATSEIMYCINTKVVREPIEYIDSTRENDIDGLNTTYYVRNWEGKFIGDANLDGTIDVSDIVVYVVASDDTETVATVSSVDYDDSSFVLSTAYTSSYNLYVSYSYCYFDPDTPDPLLGLAASYLAASYAYLKRDVGMSGAQKFGNVSINTKLSDTYGQYHKRYLDIMKKINSRGSLEKSWVDSKVNI